jgi:hypothetical protein
LGTLADFKGSPRNHAAQLSGGTLTRSKPGGRAMRCASVSAFAIVELDCHAYGLAPAVAAATQTRMVAATVRK